MLFDWRLDVVTDPSYAPTLCGTPHRPRVSHRLPFESFEACTPCGPRCLRIQTLSYTLMKKDNLDRPYEHHRERTPFAVTLTLEFDTMATLMAHLNEALAINKITSITEKEEELKVPPSPPALPGLPGFPGWPIQ